VIAYEAVCFDCRVRTKLGSGCASTWLVWAKTTAEIDSAPEHLRTLAKNQRWRAFVLRHEGHELDTWSDDYTWEQGDVVSLDDGGAILDLRGFVPEDV
jgi:hypothetical protein